MQINILALAAQFGIETVFLALSLWILIKVQSLDYKFPGLIGSAALACAIDLVPFVGHYIGLAVLLLCIKKVTNADLFPDVVFTVAVSGALTFCLNLFLIGMLLGDLRHRPEPEPPKPPAKTNVATNIVKPPEPPKTNPPPVKVTNDFSKIFTLKGVNRGEVKPLAMFNTGVRNYTIALGESITVVTAKGEITVQCDEITDNDAVLTVDGQTLKLSLK